MCALRATKTSPWTTEEPTLGGYANNQVRSKAPHWFEAGILVFVQKGPSAPGPNGHKDCIGRARRLGGDGISDSRSPIAHSGKRRCADTDGGSAHPYRRGPQSLRNCCGLTSPPLMIGCSGRTNRPRRQSSAGPVALRRAASCPLPRTIDKMGNGSVAQHMLSRPIGGISWLDKDGKETWSRPRWSSRPAASRGSSSRIRPLGLLPRRKGAGEEQGGRGSFSGRRRC